MEHPRGLIVLFLTEMWERFGYYLMLTLFALYLNEYWHLDEGTSSSWYGLYIALIYLSPLFCGMVADKIGHKLSVKIGATTMAVGYLLIGVPTINVLVLACALVILGNGFFKPSIGTLVGKMYYRSDPRRDSAFSYFYLGVNVGAFFAPFAAAYLRSNYGWQYAFSAAGIGMFLGLAIFSLFAKIIPSVESENGQEVVIDPQIQKQRDYALYFMCVVVMFFWAAFHQNGSTQVFYARDHIDRTLGGALTSALDPVYYEAINSFFILVMIPVIVKIFRALGNIGKEPSTPIKIGMGMLLIGLGYFVFQVSSLLGGDTGRVSSKWFIHATFWITLGEILLSPMGLSMVSKLANPKKVARMMGIWYLATAGGNYLAGYLGKYWLVWTHSRFFGVLVLMCLGAGGFLFLFKGWLNGVMPKEIPNTGADSMVPPDLRKVQTIVMSNLGDDIKRQQLLTAMQDVSQMTQQPRS